MSSRHKMEERSTSFLRHYPSTPHLESFTTGVGGAGVINGGNGGATVAQRHPFNSHTLSGATSNVNLFANSYMPKTNFSTFMQQKKPVPPPKTSTLSSNGTNGRNNQQQMQHHQRFLYQDDPNPYKVSTIDEYRIKVNDPFLPSKSPASHRNSQMFSFYTRNEDDVEDDHDDVSRRFIQMDLNGEHHYGNAGGPAKVQRSATSASGGGLHQPHQRLRTHRRSGSASVSASSASTGEIDIDEQYILSSDAGYEDGFNHPRLSSRVSGEDCNGGGTGGGEGENGIIIPGPISDASCNSSEGYSSVSAATSCSAASEPDPYAVPNTGRLTSSPDEGSVMEEHHIIHDDSGIETPPSTRITKRQREQIEYALMGRKTTIYAADCQANLYVMRKSNFVSRPNSSLSNTHNGSSYSGQSSASYSSSEAEWVLKYTGVPVLLLDLGETKSRDKRRIQIVLAELDSGLVLWKDVIDNLSSYKEMEGSHTFHTMHLSTDHTKLIGLSFDDEKCAEGFFKEVEKLTSDFANISLSGSKSKSKDKKKQEKIMKNAKSLIKTKFVRPKKSEISSPCCFNHITTISSTDKKRFPSLQNFVIGESEHSSSNGIVMESSGGGIQQSTSHEDFVNMSPLALADSRGSDLHF